MKIDFLTIFTDKLEESIAFYTEVLGFTLDNRVPAGGGVTLVFLSDGHGGAVELVDRGVAVPTPANCPLAITVKVEAMAKVEKMLEAKGVAKTFGPTTMPNGVILLHVSDPNGVTINFVEMGNFAH